ncbi:hypothetical protein Calhy_0342 [Caldicellulosiruptor hydrothermalis 108]|uniref:Uncharacterized protein n=1 Tax=Caldicellulosiruptor hydrothermalis (strain DSM 18901 / VKM B-2411 / 108) TaxID=632292 RepID=E4QBI8_CALH1|nr:hypothetical protein [Caldicellulosiruptor hydrothermalis]ADQ06090.1 hypothetical protein Calhy_0342 [Caldicellulosiruptor hydrothermalis 108]
MNCWACNKREFTVSFESGVRIFCSNCGEELTKDEIEDFLDDVRERLYYKKVSETEDEE